jgi:parallel beta-helix repeat protein
MYDSVDCIAQGNIIQRAAIAGLASYGSLRPQFTGNNVSDCKEGLRLYPNETTVGGKTVQQPTTDAIVEGNTIVMPYRALRWAIYVGVLGKAGKLALMNNRYGQRGGMSPNFVDASETITPVLFEGTLQKWAQHTGQEQGSVDMVSGYVVPSPVPTGGIQ